MSSSYSKNLPPPLPEPSNRHVARKLVSSLSYIVSALAFWFILLMIPTFYVVSPIVENEGIARTFWDVLIEEYAALFMIVNLLYFLLIPLGVVVIAINVIRFPWWTYPLVPGLAVAAIWLAIAFS